MNKRRHVQAFVSGSWLRSSLRRPLAALPDRVGWGEFVTLAALLVCVSGLYIFAKIVDDALEGETHHFDRTVRMALRTTADPADPVGPPWLKIAFRDLTAFSGYPWQSHPTCSPWGKVSWHAFCCLQSMRSVAVESRICPA